MRRVEYTHFRIDVSCMSGGGGAIGVIFSYGRKGYCAVRWEVDGTFEVKTVIGGDQKSIMKDKGPKPGTDEMKQLTVEVRGQRVLVEVDGNLVMQTPGVDAVESGSVGLLAEKDPGAVFDNIRITKLIDPKL
jgi:hypothetical protein